MRYERRGVVIGGRERERKEACEVRWSRGRGERGKIEMLEVRAKRCQVL